MTHENLLKVRERIAEIEGFDMGIWHTSCGTAMCIGSTAEMIMREEGAVGNISDTDVAAWMGISHSVAAALFFAFHYEISLYEIDVIMAQRAIDNVIDHNDPFWDHV